MVARVLVIGGDAAGATAASAVTKELGDDVEVVMLERGPDTSFSACGIPYWIGGEVDERSDLVARTPAEHRAAGIDVRLHTEAVAVDPATRTVTVRDAAGESELGYDHLLIATGAEPLRPDLPGIGAENVFGVQTLVGGDEVLAALQADPAPERAVVVGSGYIGLEMAEAMVQRGLEVTVVEQAPEPLPLLDADLGHRLAGAMDGLGIRFAGSSPVTGFETEDGVATAVVTADGRFPADLVVLGLGVRARTSLATDARLPTAAHGGLVTDHLQRVEGHDDIWAAGDCVVSLDRLTGQKVHLPLGTHANKQGLVAGQAIAATLRGEPARLRFGGVVRTAVTKICDLEIAITGLSEEAARVAGFDPVVGSVDSTTRAGYYPGAEKLTVRLVADRTSRRVLGGQIIGGTGSAWRIDVVAMALWTETTADDLMMTDLAYAPPFSSVWDPVQVAARALVKQL